MGLESMIAKWRLSVHVKKHLRRLATWVVTGFLALLASGQLGRVGEWVGGQVTEDQRKAVIGALVAFLWWVTTVSVDGIRSWWKFSQKKGTSV